MSEPSDLGDLAASVPATQAPAYPSGAAAEGTAAASEPPSHVLPNPFSAVQRHHLLHLESLQDRESPNSGASSTSGAAGASPVFAQAAHSPPPLPPPPAQERWSADVRRESFQRPPATAGTWLSAEPGWPDAEQSAAWAAEAGIGGWAQGQVEGGQEASLVVPGGPKGVGLAPGQAGLLARAEAASPASTTAGGDDGALALPRPTMAVPSPLAPTSLPALQLPLAGECSSRDLAGVGSDSISQRGSWPLSASASALSPFPPATRAPSGLSARSGSMGSGCAALHGSALATPSGHPPPLLTIDSGEPLQPSLLLQPPPQPAGAAVAAAAAAAQVQASLASQALPAPQRQASLPLWEELRRLGLEFGRADHAPAASVSAASLSASAAAQLSDSPPQSGATTASGAASAAGADGRDAASLPPELLPDLGRSASGTLLLQRVPGPGPGPPSGVHPQLSAVPESGPAAGAAGPGASGSSDWDELRVRDAQIMVLQRKLAHYRSWMAGVQARVAATNPSAINNYRRLYVGNLPPNTSEEELKSFLSSLMQRVGANAAPGCAILSCKMKAAPSAGSPSGPMPGLPPPGVSDKHYAFIELRSVEEASNAMALDGVAFKGAYLKVRRPSNYDAATALMLGPTQPDPTIDLSDLDMCRTVVENSPHKLFVGGLPCEWGEDLVKELLLPYGTLKSFNLVMDKTTGKSKGYAFCEYTDEAAADLLIRALHARRLGSKALTVKRAVEGAATGGGAVAAVTAAGVAAGPSRTGSAGGAGGAAGVAATAAAAAGGIAPAALLSAYASSHTYPQSAFPHLQPPTPPHTLLSQQLAAAAAVVGSPPALPITPVNVAAMARQLAMEASPAAGPNSGGSMGSAGGGGGAAAAASMAAAAAALGRGPAGAGRDAEGTSSTAMQVADAITALLQQHSANTATGGLLTVASGGPSSSGAAATPPPAAPTAAAVTAAGLAAALQQYQRTTERATVGSAGGAGGGGAAAGGAAGELQRVSSYSHGAPPPPQFATHPAFLHTTHSHHHHHALLSSHTPPPLHHAHSHPHTHQEAAAAAAVAAAAAHEMAAVHQLAAAAAAVAQGGMAGFDLSGLAAVTGHGGLGF